MFRTFRFLPNELDSKVCGIRSDLNKRERNRNETNELKEYTYVKSLSESNILSDNTSCKEKNVIVWLYFRDERMIVFRRQTNTCVVDHTPVCTLYHIVT